jgi:hypothetical protein
MALYDNFPGGTPLEMAKTFKPSPYQQPAAYDSNQSFQTFPAAAAPAPASAAAAAGGLDSMLKMAGAATGVGAALQLGLGAYQFLNTQRLKNEFEQQKKASFKDALGPIQENKMMFERQYRQGLSPEARNVYQSQMAGDMTRSLRAAEEISGGQSSAALSRMLSVNMAKGAQNLALMDQQARERAMVGLAGANREIASAEQMDLQRKMRMEDMTMQQIAGLGQDALKNVSGAIGAVPKGLSNLAYIQALSSSKTV